MNIVLLGTSWLLVSLIALYVWLGSGGFNCTAATGELSVGLRFPFSELAEVIKPWYTRTRPFVLIVASAECGNCQPLLDSLGETAKGYPEVQLLLLLQVHRPDITHIIGSYEWAFPVVPLTTKLQQTLEIQAYPTVYVVGRDGRIAEREESPSTERFLALMEQAAK